MMDGKCCQSCGMPMGETKEHFGTNADGSISEDYCKYCYMDGKFTGECTMEEMVEICVPHMIKGDDNMTEEQARGIMKELLPTLKRWKS